MAKSKSTSTPAGELTVLSAISIVSQLVAAAQKSGMMVGTTFKKNATPSEIVALALTVIDILDGQGVTLPGIKGLITQVLPVIGMFVK